MEPTRVRYVSGNPPRSLWRPRKSRQRPDAVPEKQFPGKAYRLIGGVDPGPRYDQNGDDSDSSFSSSFPPYRKPGLKGPYKVRKKKKPKPSKDWQPFSGNGYRLDGIPVGRPSSEISAAALTATRERWTPPTTTPSLKPPKRIFPSLGLGSRIKKLFPGRRTRKERPNAAEPSPPLDPQAMRNEGSSAAEPSPPLDPEAVEGGRKPARKSTLFPGNGRKLDEGSPPASPRRSGTPAASHHSESDKSNVPSPRGQFKALREDVRKFPGVPRLLQKPEGESEELRPADVDWHLLRQDLARSDSGSSSRPSTDDSQYGDWVRWKEKEEKRAYKKKWPGKGYQIQPPPPQPTAAGTRPGLGLSGNRPRNRPSDDSLSSDSDGGNSDSSQQSGKKFPGTGYTIKDAARDTAGGISGDATE